jgi:hypothetical protein
MGVLIARTSIEQISEEEAIGILKKLNKPRVNYFE